MELWSPIILQNTKPGFSSSFLEKFQLSVLCARSGTDLESRLCERNLSIFQDFSGISLLLQGVCKV